MRLNTSLLKNVKDEDSIALLEMFEVFKVSDICSLRTRVFEERSYHISQKAAMAKEKDACRSDRLKFRNDQRAFDIKYEKLDNEFAKLKKEHAETKASLKKHLKEDGGKRINEKYQLVKEKVTTANLELVKRKNKIADLEYEVKQLESCRADVTTMKGKVRKLEHALQRACDDLDRYIDIDYDDYFPRSCRYRPRSPQSSKTSSVSSRQSSKSREVASPQRRRSKHKRSRRARKRQKQDEGTGHRDASTEQSVIFEDNLSVSGDEYRHSNDPSDNPLLPRLFQKAHKDTALSRLIETPRIADEQLRITIDVPLDEIPKKHIGRIKPIAKKAVYHETKFARFSSGYNKAINGFDETQEIKFLNEVAIDKCLDRRIADIVLPEIQRLLNTYFSDSNIKTNIHEIETDCPDRKQPDIEFRMKCKTINAIGQASNAKMAKGYAFIIFYHKLRAHAENCLLDDARPRWL